MIRGIVAVALVMAISSCGISDPRTTYAPLQHPFRGATLYLDADTTAAEWQAAHGAGWLEPITKTPQARWLTGPDAVAEIPDVVRRANRQGALLVLVAYYLPNRDCAGPGHGAPDAAAYDEWVRGLIGNLGATRAVIIVEPDAVPADCFDEPRAELLKRTVRRLAGAGHYVYLDAGHPRWRGVSETAERLVAAGIADAEGFSVNVANRQSTNDSQRWGMELSRMVGSRRPASPTGRAVMSARSGSRRARPGI